MSADLPTRLCAGAPLLFVALLMAIDPDALISSLDNLAVALRNFDHRLHGVYWRERPRAVEHMPVARLFVRAGGIACAASAFLVIAGVY